MFVVFSRVLLGFVLPGSALFFIAASDEQATLTLTKPVLGLK
jgi:hypothetical protein